MEQKGGKKEKKTRVPALLQMVLDADVYLTKVFVKNMEVLLPIKQMKTYYKALEISCHGVLWITCILMFIWILDNKNLYQMQINLLIGLFLDIAIIAILKALTRRRRPAVNDDPFAMGPDKYSFPSGHASRASLICWFFMDVSPISPLYVLILLTWCAAISVSRLLMKRHYILDVCLGLLIGVFEAVIVKQIYLESATCVRLVSWITDEKIPGAEYDV